MRFDEPDVREAYRQGARDCYDAFSGEIKPSQAREMEAWLSELEDWQEGDPPATPLA